ncbi:hypothetical protein OG349_06355 [Streptomyces sp. NBC_01317]|uniref:LexA family protein n=1 Tax=Streptomyces sp. NBC_01317 TaxID=2903822 RepID=UPI002E0DA4EB|nr:hypothetical protein OG349_06355 [Streptomyces sp. NBC_01317]
MVRAWIADREEGPSIREIGREVGLSSTSSVAYQLRRMEERGLLDGVVPQVVVQDLVRARDGEVDRQVRGEAVGGVAELDQRPPDDGAVGEEQVRGHLARKLRLREELVRFLGPGQLVRSPAAHSAARVSSPPARGCSAVLALVTTFVRVLPASAGVFRRRRAPGPSRRRPPRQRGGVPRWGFASSSLLASSPSARGCFGVSLGVGSRVLVFPAGAGVCRRALEPRPRPSGPPGRREGLPLTKPAEIKGKKSSTRRHQRAAPAPLRLWTTPGTAKFEQSLARSDAISTYPDQHSKAPDDLSERASNERQDTAASVISASRHRP